MNQLLLDLHVAAAIAGFVLSGVIAVGVLRRPAVQDLGPGFWRWQRITQWTTVVLGAAGTALYLTGHRPKDPLHLLYGALALLATILLGAFGPGKDPQELMAGWKVNPRWILFGLNVFLWAMYGRGLSTGFFGV